MDHHRLPPMMSNGGHGGQQHHHQQQSQQQQPSQHHLHPHPSQPTASTTSAPSQNDVDELHARLGYMSMNDNGVSSVNGLTSSNQNDYSSHLSHQQAQQHQRSSQPSNPMHSGANVIYYSNVNVSQSPSSGSTSSVHPQYQGTHPSQLQHQQQQQALSGTRSLNPCAAIFVPRGFIQGTPSMPMSHRPNNSGHQHHHSQPQHHSQHPHHQHHYQNGSARSSTMASQQSQAPSTTSNAQFEYSNEFEDFLALSYLKEFIYVIANKPAMLNMHGLQEITHIINTYLEEDDCVLELVVNQVVDHSIVDVNFRFSGVKMCLHFMTHIRENSSGTFKNLLFRRIHRECSRKMPPNTSNSVAHMSGLALFTGDLFLQTTSEEVGEALPNLLMNLCSSNVKFLDDTCKCICQVLKLCGKELDDMFRKKATSDFENVITKLSEVVKRDEMSENVKIMIRSILKSREENWVSQSPKWSSDVPKESQQQPPTFYGDYVEADDFEGGNIYFPSNTPVMGYDFGNGDEDNQEICEDFENFLMNLPQHLQ